MQRLRQHNAGEAKSTSFRRPLQLLFTENYLFEVDARRREMYFKTSMGRKALRLMLISTLENLGYKGQIFNMVFEKE